MVNARQIAAWPGHVIDRAVEGGAVAFNGLRQAGAWITQLNRPFVLGYMERHFPDCFAQLDGGDKRIIRAFLDPESFSNTYSILGGKSGSASEYASLRKHGAELLSDAFGAEARFDNSFVDPATRAQDLGERWFFVNGIVTSRGLARHNRTKLEQLFERGITLIHNPTQGLTYDLVESTLQKFTNINTEVVARAFLEIGEALLAGKRVVLLAHSQGTIITGDVLDLLYCSIDRAFFDRTNMNDKDFDSFMRNATGTVKAGELCAMRDRLAQAGTQVLDQLELYMFANAASRMCYADAPARVPHIESYANEHDVVTRLGSLARGEFFEEDLIRIDGPLFSNDRYGHLLEAHYLPGFEANAYRLLAPCTGRCVGTSLHEPVTGNPAGNHPKYVAGPERPRLREYLGGASPRAPGAPASPRTQSDVAPRYATAPSGNDKTG
jgi:hypothetical protein